MNIKSNISRFKNSKDGKTLASNMVYLSLLQIASYLFPFLTMAYLARVLGVERLGTIGFAAAIIMWIQTIADWGFNYTATREVAQNRDNPEKVSIIFSKVLWARCILALVSLAVLAILVAIIPQFRQDALIIFFTYLLVPGHILYPDWFFQALERMKYITILGILFRFVFTISVFVFIKEADDYIYQPLLVSFGYLCSGLVAMYFILIRWKVKLRAIPLQDIWLTIKGSTNVFLNNLMPNLYNSFSVILLGTFCTKAHTGLYDNGKKFTTLSNTAMSVISRVFFPFLSRRIDKHKFYSIFTLSIAAVVSLVLVISAPWLVPWYFGAEFAGATPVLQITAPAIFFVAASEVYGTNYLIVNRYEKTMRNITFASSLLGFAISFPLVLNFQHIGAAIVFSTSSFASALLSYIYYIKIKTK